MRTHPVTEPTTDMIRHVLFSLSVEPVNCFALLSNQSGDLSHVIAALHMTKHPAGFILIKRSDDARGPGSMMADLEACGFADNVHILTVGPLPKEEAIELYNALAGREGLVKSPSDATARAQQAVKSLHVGRPIRKEWQELLFDESYKPTALFAKLTVYCIFKNFPKGEPLVCIWTRTSGKRTETRPAGGANPQFDSSNQGMAEICNKLSLRCRTVLIGPHCEKVIRHLKSSAETVIPLAEYWLEEPFSTLSRIEQCVLFHFLVLAWRCPVVHLGMKSGQMDMLALWGQPTVFIEDEASPTKKRSQDWTGKGGQIKDGKLGVSSAAFVSKLPTLTGQAIRSTDARPPSLKESDWKKVDAIEIEKDQRGFEEEDLELILSRVNTQLQNAAKTSVELTRQRDAIGKAFGEKPPN